MGYQVDRFIKKVPSSQICSNCQQVFQNPKQCNRCSKVFCKNCINHSLSHILCKNQGFKQTSVSNFFIERLNKLRIRCKFANNGCKTICELNRIENHEISCKFITGQMIDNFLDDALLSQKAQKSQDLSISIRNSNKTSVRNSRSGSPSQVQVYSPNSEEFQMSCGECQAKLNPQDAQQHNCVQWLFAVINHQNDKYITIQQQYQQKNEILQKVVKEYQDYQSATNDYIKKLELQNEEQEQSINQLKTQRSISPNYYSVQNLQLTSEQLHKAQSKQYLDVCQQILNKFQNNLSKQLQQVIDTTNYAFAEHKDQVLKVKKTKFINGQKLARMGITTPDSRSRTPSKRYRSPLNRGINKSFN